MKQDWPPVEIRHNAPAPPPRPLQQGGTPIDTAPLHAIEVRIAIGAHDWEYVMSALEDALKTLKADGASSALMSGSPDGVHRVDIQRREVTKEQYQKELMEYSDRQRRSRTERK